MQFFSLQHQMSALSNDILGILDKQKEPVSIHDLSVAIPHYDVYDIKVELWGLAANGLVKFDWNWRISRSNDGGADY